jgi:hypothetical protein
MSFDLAFWHEDRPISAEEARHIYWQLCDEDYSVVKPHQDITLFLQDLTQRYPPIEDLAKEEIEENPWSCAWDVTPSSVIVCMTWPSGRALAPFLIQMANQHDLVCYNPQRDEVYFPASLLNDKN